MADITVANNGDLPGKMNSASYGDRLLLENGDYNNNYFVPKNGIHFQAKNRNGARWISNGNACVFRQPGGQVNSVRDCLFLGPCVEPMGRSRFDAVWNTFREFSRGVNPGAGQCFKSATHGGGWIIDGSNITDNDFDDINGWGIGAWYGLNSVIKANRFNCANAIKMDAFKEFHRNMLVQQNLLENISRMYGEFQGRGVNYVIEYNYSRMDRIPGGGSNDHLLGWSAILHGEGQSGNRCRYNTMEATRYKADGSAIGSNDYVRLFFELGNAWLCEHNQVGLNGGKMGTFTSVYMGDSSGPKPESSIDFTDIRNNRIPGAMYGQGSAYGQYPAKCRYSNNNANVQLPNITGLGMIPGPGKDITQGSSFPPPDWEDERPVPVGSFNAAYWNNTQLSGTPELLNTTKSIDFDWGEGSPDPKINPNNFSARYVGKFQLAAGQYKMTAKADDGIRVWVDNKLIFDDWTIHAPRDYETTLTLDASEHTVKVEYFEQSVGAQLQLLATPSGEPTPTEEIHDLTFDGTDPDGKPFPLKRKVKSVATGPRTVTPV